MGGYYKLKRGCFSHIMRKRLFSLVKHVLSVETFKVEPRWVPMSQLCFIRYYNGQQVIVIQVISTQCTNINHLVILISGVFLLYEPVDKAMSLMT